MDGVHPAQPDVLHKLQDRTQCFLIYRHFLNLKPVALEIVAGSMELRPTQLSLPMLARQGSVDFRVANRRTVEIIRSSKTLTK